MSSTKHLLSALTTCFFLLGVKGWPNNVGANWFSSQSQPATQHDESARGEEQGRRFFSRQLGSMFCGASTTDPSGQCTNVGACFATGGVSDVMGTQCGGLEACCKYTYGCNTYMNSGVGYWRSRNYPEDATDPGSCQLIVQTASDTCWIRIQFEDTQLTAANFDTCDGNFLTINNQEQGDSSLICGALDKYETIVRVKTIHALLPPQNVLLNLNIRDSTFKYSVKITRISCDMITGVSGGRSFDNQGRSLDAGAEDVHLNSLDYDHELNNLNLQMLDSVHEETLSQLQNVLDESEPSVNHHMPSKDDLINLKNRYEDIENEQHTSLHSNVRLQFDRITSLADEKDFVSDDGTVSVRDLCSVAERDATQRIATSGFRRLKIEGQAPYFGKIMVRNEKNQYYFCGATLIAPNYVLTAASCLLRRGSDTNNYAVRAYFDLKNDLGNRRYKKMWNITPFYGIKRVIFHPMYEHKRFDYDIAVIELNKNVLSTNTPIKLATAGNLYEGTQITVTGHGTSGIKTQLSSRNLVRFGVLLGGTTFKNSDCQTAYKADVSSQTIDDHMICFGLGSDKQTCEGDQGGPVVAGHPSSPVLVGIISGNQHNCVEIYNEDNFVLGKYPDVAVRISSVLDFINAATTTIEYSNNIQKITFMDLISSLFT